MARFEKLLNDRSAAYLLLAITLFWLIAASLPEILRDRIFPFDSALYAANGALFEKMYAEFGSFLAAPGEWLWNYYDQYPALSVRRHPPLFGLVSGVVYTIFGVSVASAKLTVMLFAVAFTIGVYFAAQRLLSGHFAAACTALLVVSTPQVAMHFRSIWLDIPSLALAVWVFFFYIGRLNGDRSLKNVMAMVVFSVLALYTYQPTLVLLTGVFIHLLLREWRSLFKDRAMLVGAGLLVILMLPLVAFTLYFASDNLLITTGELPDAWEEFSSPTYADWLIRDKLSVAYWSEYGRMFFQTYPLQFAGVCLWALLRFFRQPRSAEVLMLVCLIVTYVGFSWLLVKGHRYTLYMVVPASFMTVAAIYDLTKLVSHDAVRSYVYSGAAVLLLSGLQSGIVSAYVPYRFLWGMDEPVDFVLNENPEARILYSGRCDSAFVFYTRSRDSDGQASIHRASVQVTDTADLLEYVDNLKIDYVVVEVENPAYDSLEVIDDFRDTILSKIPGYGDFRLRAEFELPYGAFEQEGSVLLHVYGRSL